MDDKLKHLLQAQLEREAGRGPRDASAAMSKGRRKKTITRLGVGSGVVLLAVAVAWTAVAKPFADVRTSVAAPPPTAEDCPVSRGQTEGSEWTSPTSFIADGSFNGQTWVLCARTIERIETAQEGLCMNWRIGEGPGSGMGCAFMSDRRNNNVALDEDYFFPVMGPEEGYIYGATPAATATLELETEKRTITGTVYPAPDELGGPFSFFTIFDEPYAEGVLIARDEDGEVLVRRRMDHGLDQLSVTLSGDGEGTVQAYRTAELRYYEECQREELERCRKPRQTWIDCPEVCSAALDRAEVTLIARPDEGSTFAGWSGDCIGARRCELVVNRAREVEARFTPTG